MPGFSCSREAVSQSDIFISYGATCLNPTGRRLIHQSQPGLKDTGMTTSLQHGSVLHKEPYVPGDAQGWSVV